MKYKDKGTIRSYLKQQEKYEEEKTDRSIRRKLDREYKKFLSKFYKYVERDWWDSVDDKTKKSLYDEWIHIKLMSRNTGEEADFAMWVKMVRRDTKPNTIIYRDKIIDRILDEQ